MAVPITGQVDNGVVTVSDAWMEKVKPVVLENEKVGLPPATKVLVTTGRGTPAMFCTTESWLNPAEETTIALAPEPCNKVDWAGLKTILPAVVVL